MGVFKSFTRDNHGSSFDILVICAVVLALGIVILVGHYLKDNILPEIRAVVGTEPAAIIGEADTAFAVLDYVFIAVTVGLGIAAVVSAFMIPTHPVFFFLSILILMIGLILAPTFSNVFRDISDDNKFTNIVDSYPFMKTMFENFPTFILMFGALIMIATYAKLRSGPTGGGI